MRVKRPGTCSGQCPSHTEQCAADNIADIEFFIGNLDRFIVYGFGMERILKKYPKFGKVLTILIIGVISGFAFSEIVKFKLATDSWNFYKDDFNWVKSNTNKDEVFLLGSQCLPLRLDRKAVFPSLSIDTDDYDYVWVNQEFKLEPQSILSDENLKKLENKEMQLVYENKMTKTKIYNIIKNER